MQIAAFSHQRKCHLYQFDDLVHQATMIPANAIPLQHAELGIVPAPSFTVAEHTAQLVAIADTGREQTLLRELRRRTQPARTRSGIHMSTNPRGEALDIR